MNVAYVVVVEDRDQVALGVVHMAVQRRLHGRDGGRVGELGPVGGVGRRRRRRPGRRPPRRGRRARSRGCALGGAGAGGAGWPGAASGAVAGGRGCRGRAAGARTGRRGCGSVAMSWSARKSSESNAFAPLVERGVGAAGYAGRSTTARTYRATTTIEEQAPGDHQAEALLDPEGPDAAAVLGSLVDGNGMHRGQPIRRPGRGPVTRRRGPGRERRCAVSDGLSPDDAAWQRLESAEVTR